MPTFLDVFVKKLFFQKYLQGYNNTVVSRSCVLAENVFRDDFEKLLWKYEFYLLNKIVT